METETLPQGAFYRPGAAIEFKRECRTKGMATHGRRIYHVSQEVF